eukprot:scaffold21269_cov60-Phaeocystis_antarctica.AAC.5
MHALERNCVPSAAKRSKVEKTSRSSHSAFDDRPRHLTMYPQRPLAAANVAAGGACRRSRREELSNG